jgi:hypothetical protein
MNVPHIADINDDELMVYAIREGQLILAQHIERSPRDAEETANYRWSGRRRSY